MRVHWWLVFVLSGVVVGVVGAALLSGTAQFVVICLAVVLVFFALYRRAGGTDYNRERPVPPGSGGSI
jgi:uncharacterized membrane protein YhaH (DUF805 family)